ncbi:MAG: T9SS type A sorting domain-containing protein, partial [Bacteroidota bacterium]
SPWVRPRGDYNNDNVIDYGTGWNGSSPNEGSGYTIKVEEFANGTIQPLYRDFGMHNDAFNGHARRPAFSSGDALNMGTNPMITNYPTYNYGARQLNAVNLNGLQVRFEDAGNGDLRVYVFYKNTIVGQDTRWAGNFTLPDITGDANDDLVLAANQKILVDRSATANRHTMSPDNDFVNSTEFLVDSDAKVHLLNRSVMYVADRSTMTVNPSTTLEIEDEGCLVIDETSTLHLKDDNILLNGPLARVVVQGNLILDAGVNFTPSAPLNAGFQYQVDCNTGSLQVQPDVVSLLVAGESYCLMQNNPNDPGNTSTQGDVLLEELTPKNGNGNQETFATILQREEDYYVVRKVWSHCMDTVTHTVHSIQPSSINNPITPDFTYSISGCSDPQQYLTVKGVDQPAGSSPYHQFNLYEYDPVTGADQLLEIKGWSDQANASNYVYQRGPFTFNTQLDPAKHYYVKRGVWDACTEWREKRIYDITIKGTPNPLDPGFTWQLTSCNAQGDRSLIVAGNIQPVGTSPYHQFNLYEYDPATGADQLLEVFAWWQQPNAANYTYQMGPYTLSTPIEQGKHYYVKRGVWDACTDWREHRIYNIVSDPCPEFWEGQITVGMFPNPARDEVKLTMSGLQVESPLQIILLDFAGEMVSEVANIRRLERAEYSTQFTVRGFKPGLYYLSVSAGESRSTHKLMVE